MIRLELTVELTDDHQLAERIRLEMFPSLDRLMCTTGVRSVSAAITVQHDAP